MEDGIEQLSSLEEQLDELCIYYMSMGVPYEVFWYGDPCCLKYYEEVYLRKRKIHNEEMWMQGVYNFVAHQTTLGNAFRAKGHSPHEYLKEPIAFFPKTEQELRAEERKKKAQIVQYLNAFKDAWDRKHGRNGRNSEPTNKDS